ncbi:MAG TPA: hypothetical protein VM536_05235 [Chloroflexia bacterium]|nr:hypothetical protein [Chloroflexia bacterium]
MRTFDELRAVARFSEGLGAPWWIAGGWAIDCWLGTVSREHEDIEISVLRRDQAHLYAYCGDWPRFTPRDDVWVPMQPGEELVFPEFQVQVRPPATDVAMYLGLPDEFEFMLNNVESDEWIFRPEPTIRRAWHLLRLPAPGDLWVTAPEAVLLHKGRHHRPKDEQDFAVALPRMSSEQRAWLRASLAQIRPADPWLAVLDAAG